MGLPESVTYLLLVLLGYALTRVVDLACDWLRGRLRGADDQPDLPPGISATARQRVMERRAAYTRFRKSVNDAVAAAVDRGHGTYGMLYQIRDYYGDLLRQSPTGVAHAADSVIRCVTLLINLGPSDQRYAMFTRALNHFDRQCAEDQGLVIPPGPRRREFSVLDESRGEAVQPSGADALPSENDSGSARARTLPSP